MNRNSNILAGLAIASAFQSITAHLVKYQPFIYFFKPLTLLLLLALANLHWRREKQPYALWISLGLFFSLFGDILLLWPDKLFLPGLTAFLLTHVAYFIAFTRDVKLLFRPIALLYLLIAVATYALLRPNLPGELRIPVALYALLLSAMAAQATIRSLVLKTAAAKLAATGALFFMVSDFLLAFDRFQTAIPLASVLILGPYYVGQFLIAISTRPAGS